jgi:predicted molibdopterin-dependent oxidoreductase YjgC
MVRRVENDAAVVLITVDGEPVEAREGDSVAAALIGAGKRALRTTAVSGAPRGVYCMMGACYDCLVAIDGAPNRQACMTLVSAGMAIRSQCGAAEASS